MHRLIWAVAVCVLATSVTVATDNHSCAESVYYLLQAHATWSGTYVQRVSEKEGLTVTFMDGDLNLYSARIGLQASECTAITAETFNDFISAHNVELLTRNCFERRTGPLVRNRKTSERLRDGVPASGAVIPSSSAEVFKQIEPKGSSAISSACMTLKGVVKAEVVIDGTTGKVAGIVDTTPELSIPDFTSLMRLLREYKYAVAPKKDVRVPLTFSFDGTEGR